MSKHGAAGAKLAKFFRENPEEWLTLADIATKLSVSKETAKNALRAATATGLPIQRESVYFVKPRETK